MKDKTSNIANKIFTSIKANTDFSNKECKEITFHMIDWFDDLCSVYNTFDSIDTHSNEEIFDSIMNFLIHAPEHINKASNLLVGTEIKNIFDESEE